MKKLLFVLIFILIGINSYLFFIDSKAGGDIEITRESETPADTVIDKETIIPEMDEFQIIDMAFFEKGLDKRQLYSRKTDSLWFKYIKVPDSVSLSRYNLFFQKLMSDNNIKIDKAAELESSGKMIYNFTLKNSIPATVEIRIVSGLESGLNLNGSLCVIVYSMGNEWGKQWVRDLLALQIPLTISVMPNNPPAWARDTIIKEAEKNNKDVIVCLPMEPVTGNINKENPVKLVQGMNYLSIDIVFDKISELFNGAKGIINFKGSKVISDNQTMEQFFKKMSATGMAYIEIEAENETHSEILCEQYSVPFISTREHYENAEELKENFDRISAEISSGNDILLVVNANEGIYNFIKDDLLIKYGDLNFISVVQFIKQKK